MSTDHRRLDLRYISSLIRPLVKVELSVSVAALQAVGGQITGTYSCTYWKAWLGKQRAKQTCSVIGRHRTACWPGIWTHCVEKNQKLLLYGILKKVQHLTPTNFNLYSRRRSLHWRIQALSPYYQHLGNSSIWQYRGTMTARVGSWPAFERGWHNDLTNA